MFVCRPVDVDSDIYPHAEHNRDSIIFLLDCSAEMQKEIVLKEIVNNIKSEQKQTTISLSTDNNTSNGEQTHSHSHSSSSSAHAAHAAASARTNSALNHAIQIIIPFIKSKIISSPNDFIGICLMGTQVMNNNQSSTVTLIHIFSFSL